jgi:hypothetical protein
MVAGDGERREQESLPHIELFEEELEAFDLEEVTAI